MSHLIAHTPGPGSDEWHMLLDHIFAVAEMARDFAQPFGGDSLAYLVGLWHDVGKANPDFQDYLRRCHADPNHKGRGPDHKAAGAILAQRFFPPLALLVQGHHGGLGNKADLASWLDEKKRLLVSGTETPAIDAAITALRPLLPQIEPSEKPRTPAYVRDERSAEFFLRMLFSALVDADFLDTEAHRNPQKAMQRGSSSTLAELLEHFEQDQERKAAHGSGSIHEARQEMYRHCIAAAIHPPGLFRLAMPTGGGKTRAGMAFALHHAVRYNKRRVIVAVPYISITEQTAAVYRALFQDKDDKRPVVLEHHSGADAQQREADDYRPDMVWSRLASENWDAPVIVTTTVQLFESLFGCKTSACRKLHRLADSVIILDEVQALPPNLLTPILDALRELCTNYGATVVLSTATQPAFESLRVFRDLTANDIIPDAARYFTALARVRYEWRTERSLPWSEVADILRDSTQAMAIVNTKGDTLNLLDTLNDPAALHLSTLLCGAHRRDVIAEVHRRLRAGEPCLLVSTQVVEAGVDLDFPLVLRAMGPLDRIIQAAGRCNREGKLPNKGLVIVFQPEDGGMPPGPYRTATEVTRALLNAGVLDLDDPATVSKYFRRIFDTFKDPKGHLDTQGIQLLRAEWKFADVAAHFRLIDEATENVIVSYEKPGAHLENVAARQRVDAAISAIRGQTTGARAAIRQLQPYLVAIRTKTAERYRRAGFIEPVVPDSALTLGIWHGKYDSLRGIITDDDRRQLII